MWYNQNNTYLPRLENIEQQRKLTEIFQTENKSENQSKLT